MQQLMLKILKSLSKSKTLRAKEKLVSQLNRAEKNTDYVSNERIKLAEMVKAAVNKKIPFHIHDVFAIDDSERSLFLNFIRIIDTLSHLLYQNKKHTIDMMDLQISTEAYVSYLSDLEKVQKDISVDLTLLNLLLMKHMSYAEAFNNIDKLMPVLANTIDKAKNVTLTNEENKKALAHFIESLEEKQQPLTNNSRMNLLTKKVDTLALNDDQSTRDLELTLSI